MAIITNDTELALLKTSGRILADTLRAVAKTVRVGVTTKELDATAERLIRAAGGVPSFLRYEGYPASLCVSINSEVVHGIPGDRVVESGDVIGLDLGVNYQGWFTDAAITVVVGRPTTELKKFLQVTQASLAAGIKAATAENRIGDIGAAVEAVVKPHSYGIIQALVGHGVGRAVHEPPQIPNVGRPHTGPVIQLGAVLAIEPMLTLGEASVHTTDDNWTVVTDDDSLAAHFEHTIVVTKSGPVIVTA